MSRKQDFLFHVLVKSQISKSQMSSDDSDGLKSALQLMDPCLPSTQTAKAHSNITDQY